MQIIRGSGLAQSQWPNGAGRKADIASGAGWLVSFAWLERDAPFSDYAEHDRTITLLEGGGFVLDLPEGSLLTVSRTDTPASFDGKGPIACRLLAGPCTVLNVISAYPAISHTVQVFGPDEIATFAPTGIAFLVVLRGALRTGDAEARRLDTLVFKPGEDLHPSADARIAGILVETSRETEDDEG